MDEETAQTGADARAYYAQVPAPMVCGTALVTDAEGRILVVEPSYKPGLDLPGGLVLDQESPRQGLARELVEELGLNLEVGRLLAVDTTPAAVHGRALVAHVHAVGPLTAAQVADIRFADGELSSASFLPPAEAVRRLPERLGRRVRGALEAMAAGSIAYLDDGRPQPGSPAGLPAEERIRLEESGTIGRDAHLAMRPKALTSANVLLHDGRGRALIVRPTYRQDGRWLLPGGGIDSDTGETPRAAAQRELREELGFERPLGSLLATDWSPPADRPAMVAFVYDGGPVTAAELDAVRLPPGELDAWRMVTVEESRGLLLDPLVDRLAACLDAVAAGARGLELVRGLPV